jgi:hypothetical protein
MPVIAFQRGRQADDAALSSHTVGESSEQLVLSKVTDRPRKWKRSKAAASYTKRRNSAL